MDGMGDGIRDFSETMSGPQARGVSPIATSFEMNGVNYFKYDLKTGHLKLNPDVIPEGVLESLIEQLAVKPEGISVSLQLPFEGLKEIDLVKNVAYMTPEERGEEVLPAPRRIEELLGYVGAGYAD